MKLYETLGVGPDADDDEIKAAYRRLAQRHHPDRADGDEEKFKAVGAAYEVLGHPGKRAHYDATEDVEPDEGPNIEQSARRELANLFSEILAQATTATNIRKRMELKLNDAEKGLRDQAAVVKSNIERYEAIGKILVPIGDDPSLLHHILDNKIAGFRKDLETAESVKLTLARMRELLAAYEYGPPELESVAPPFQVEVPAHIAAALRAAMKR